MGHVEYIDTIRKYYKNGKWIIEEGKERTDKGTFYLDKKLEFDNKEKADWYFNGWDKTHLKKQKGRVK